MYMYIYIYIYIYKYIYRYIYICTYFHVCMYPKSSLATVHIMSTRPFLKLSYIHTFVIFASMSHIWADKEIA